jgi:hypothetical protein
MEAGFTRRTSIRIRRACARDLDNRTAPESEITVIDASARRGGGSHSAARDCRRLSRGFLRDGRLGVVAEYHPKNLVPLAHLEHGGAFADTLTLFGADVGKPVEVPLDELERYASQPFGVAIAPDKSRIYVTCGGSEMVTGHRCAAAAALHSRAPPPQPVPFAQDLSASANYVVRAFPWDTIRAAWRSRAMAAGCLWPTGWKTRSA